MESGFNVGSTFTVADVPPFTGRLSEDLETIIVQHQTSAVETLTTPNPSGPGTITRERICVRERTSRKVKRGG